MGNVQATLKPLPPTPLLEEDGRLGPGAGGVAAELWAAGCWPRAAGHVLAQSGPRQELLHRGARSSPPPPPGASPGCRPFAARAGHCPGPLDDGPMVLQSSVGGLVEAQKWPWAPVHTCRGRPPCGLGTGDSGAIAFCGRGSVTAHWALAAQRLHSPQDKAPYDPLGFKIKLPAPKDKHSKRSREVDPRRCLTGPD